MVDAAHLADTANRNGIDAIAMSPVFYNNISTHLFEANAKYRDWISPHYANDGTLEFYHGNIIDGNYSDWIEKEV